MFKQGVGLTQERNYLINQRRRLEDNRRGYEEKTQREQNDRFKAKWEHTTQIKIERNTIKRKLEELRLKLHEQVEQRRTKLADKLATEESNYKEELETLQESSQQRRERVEQKAKQLRQNRVDRNNEIAERKLQQKFKEECDELREAQSRNNLLQVAADREGQVFEKQRRQLDEKEEQKFFDDLWHQGKVQKQQREEQEKRKEWEMNNMLRTQLDQQVDELDSKKREIEAIKEEEARLLRERWDLQEREEERKQREKKTKILQSRQHADQYNRLNRELKFEEMKRDRDMDLKLLHSVLTKEKHENNRELQKKKDMREDAERYRNWLLEQQRREKQEDAEIERMINDDNELQWKKRVDKWKQEQEARDSLMNDVIQERKSQIQRKLENAQQRREQSLAERDELMKEIDRVSRLEKEAETAKRNARKDVQYEVLNQVAENNYNKQMEQKSQVAEHRAQQYAEKMYQQRLEEEMKRLELEKPQQFKHISTFKKRY
jgi:hypothetical protein